MTDDPKDRSELETGDDPLAADLAAADPGPVDPELDPEVGPADPDADLEAGSEVSSDPTALNLDAVAGSSDREAGGEAAEDLNASELEAAASAAESEVESDEARATLDAEIADAEVGDGSIEADETEAAIEAPPLLAPGAGALERPVARSGPRASRGPKPARTIFAVDPALRIKDPVSAAFVVGTVLVFVLILANALAFGHGGAFHPLATPTPIATEAPSAVPSEGPSSSPGASGSPAASPTIAPSASPSVAPSPAAS
jgi:hypothetical protein